MRGRKPYVKLYESWWTSRSHISIPVDVLGIGARLLSMANGVAYTEEGAGVLTHDDGTPLTIEELAQTCNLEQARISSVIQAFLKVGTMAKFPSGAFGFPKQARWQESSSASRMRKFRARKARIPSDDRPSNGDRHSTVTDPSPVLARDSRQIDIEDAIQSGPPTRPSENEKGIPSYMRNSDAHSDPRSDGQNDGHVTLRVKTLNEASPLNPLPPLEGGPSENPPVERRKGSTQVDVVQRTLDFWWAKFKAEKPRSKVKPGPDSPAAKAIKRILRTSYFVQEGNETRKAKFTEQDIRLAIEGCFSSPYHLGQNDQGQKYLSLTLICRDEEKMREFMDRALHAPTPKAQLQTRPSSGSEALREWRQCRTMVDAKQRTTH